MSRSYAADLMRDDIDFGGGRGALFSRMLPSRRSDFFMALLAVAASGAILVNALALQSGVRPSQASGEAANSGIPLPLPVPPEARRAAAQPSAAQPVASQPSQAATAPVAAPLPPSKPAPVAKPRAEAVAPPAAVQRVAAQPTIGSLTADITGSIRPPAEVAISPRVMSVQKALAKLGYGPISIDGRTGTATREAIERFERDRRLPISGEVSDRLVRELTSVSGLTIQ